MRRIAVVSRHAAIADSFADAFETTALLPEECATANPAEEPDAYFIDASDADRLELVERLAERTGLPIVVLGSEGGAAQAPEYLEVGADAYVQCSASPEEWLARVRAVTRRARAPQQYEERVDFRAGDLAIIRDSRKVLLAGEEVRLTRTEFNLLLTLAERMDAIVPHRKLMAEVWGPEHISARHYLRVYVRRLREKIEHDPEHPVLLVAERGAGYLLRSAPAPTPSAGDPE